MTGDIETWRRRGEAARLAHAAVNRAFREHVRERDPDRYAKLLEDFWQKTAAALPSNDPAFMRGLAKGHVRFIETGITFLEADPWFFRSGYEKQKIIRHVKRASLSDAQRLRLARVVLAAIDGHAGGGQGLAEGEQGKSRHAGGGQGLAEGEQRKSSHAGGVRESHAGGVRERGHRVEFRHFGRLACGIWSDFLDEEVARRMRSADPGIRRRATWVAAAAIHSGKA